MPASPEVLDAQRSVWRVEVLGEAEPEEERAADGDVGVTTEVGEDLDGVGVDGEQHLPARILRGNGEDRIDDLGRQVARHHDLLEESATDQPQRLDRRDPARVRGDRDLARHVGGSNDRAGDELGEERQEQCHVEQVHRFGELAPRHVDDVADGLEREERDADRQEDLEQRR